MNVPFFFFFLPSTRDFRVVAWEEKTDTGDTEIRLHIRRPFIWGLDFCRCTNVTIRAIGPLVSFQPMYNAEWVSAFVDWGPPRKECGEARSLQLLETLAEDAAASKGLWRQVVRSKSLLPCLLSHRIILSFSRAYLITSVYIVAYYFLLCTSHKHEGANKFEC